MGPLTASDDDAIYVADQFTPRRCRRGVIEGLAPKGSGERSIGMRLASRIFLAISLVIVVLGAVAGWSLRAMNQIVGVDRALVTPTVPAPRLETGPRESLVALGRLETRHAVLAHA